jgi:hypothetical protein
MIAVQNTVPIIPITANRASPMARSGNSKWKEPQSSCASTKPIPCFLRLDWLFTGSNSNPMLILYTIFIPFQHHLRTSCDPSPTQKQRVLCPGIQDPGRISCTSNSAGSATEGVGIGVCISDARSGNLFQLDRIVHSLPMKNVLHRKSHKTLFRQAQLLCDPSGPIGRWDSA